MQMPYLYLPDNYQINQKPKYCYRPTESVNWQKAQYQFAANLVKKYSVERVVDVGAGDGIKFRNHIECKEKIAIEYGENYKICKEIIPNTLEYDLDKDWFKIPYGIDTGLICIDVIEHLKNPTKLLQSIHAMDDWLSFILITTPERELIHGVGNMGPPTNPCHVREWTVSEFQQLIRNHFYVDANIGLIGEKGKPTCMYALLVS